MFSLEKYLKRKVKKYFRRSLKVSLNPTLKTKKGYVKRQKIFSRSKYEHREIAEKTLGRKLEDGEVVHHIDFVKDNNCLDNLCVMSDRDHRHYHNWHRWMEKNKPNVDLSISYRKKKLREKWNVIILDEIDLKK